MAEVQQSFENLGLNPKIVGEVHENLGFSSLTPIQSLTIPPILRKENILALAPTGTGKTYAFLIPVVDRILTKPDSPLQALVLVPTPELASQTVRVATNFIRKLDIKAAHITDLMDLWIS